MSKEEQAIKELKDFRNSLNHSINVYGKETVDADEVLEMLDLIIKVVSTPNNNEVQDE